MSADNMLLLSKVRSQVILIMCDSEGNEFGKRKVYPLDKIIDAMIDAEKIMQINDVEYGIRPIGFIQKTWIKKT